jgi:hypothetical protein
MGAFTSKENEDNSDEENFDKLRRKRQRALHSLASSVLPIITQSLLWDLPLHADDKKHPITSPLPTRDILLETTDKMLFERRTTSSSETFRANSIVIRLLLELVAQFCDLLQERAESYLSVIFYPIVGKASQDGAPLVQSAAATVLHGIAVACGYRDSPGLIRKHFDQLAISMLGCLRIPGGKLVPGDDKIDEISSVACSLRFVLQRALPTSEQSAGRGTLERNSVHCMVEIVTLLTELFNHLIARKAVTDEKFFELIAVYTASFSFLLVNYGAKEGCNYTYRIGSTINEPSSKPWREMIAPFRVSTSAHQSPEEGFAKSAALISQDKLDHEKSMLDSHDVSIPEIEFVSRLLSKCCYFLSYNSLRMRIASCDAVISGFRFLAFVSCYQEVRGLFCVCLSTVTMALTRTAWNSVMMQKEFIR